MSDISVGAIILGAGKGTRMKSNLPKVLMPVDGKPMIRHIIDVLESMNIKKIVTVIAPDGDAVNFDDGFSGVAGSILHIELKQF